MKVQKMTYEHAMRHLVLLAMSTVQVSTVVSDCVQWKPGFQKSALGWF